MCGLPHTLLFVESIIASYAISIFFGHVTTGGEKVSLPIFYFLFMVSTDHIDVIKNPAQKHSSLWADDA